MVKDTVDPPPSKRLAAAKELFKIEELLEQTIFWLENTAHYNSQILSLHRYGLSLNARQLKHTLSELSAIRKGIDGELPK